MQPSGDKFVKGIFRIFVNGFGVIFMALFPEGGRPPLPLLTNTGTLFILCAHDEATKA
jgi:hypothetical protein